MEGDSVSEKTITAGSLETFGVSWLSFSVSSVFTLTTKSWVGSGSLWRMGSAMEVLGRWGVPDLLISCLRPHPPA